MSEPTDPRDAPPPPAADASISFDAREELYTKTLQHVDRAVHTAEALRLQLMLAGFEAMIMEETEIAGTPPRPDDPTVLGFFLHQANELRLTRTEVEHRLAAAHTLRDRLPATWAVFLAGNTSERGAVVAAAEAAGLTDREHLAAYDARAAELVQTERPTLVARLLADLRDELDPEAAAERARAAANRRHVRARAEGDGQGVLEIHATVTDIAAAYDRIRTHAVAAHGRDGETRTLGALMADAAIDAILTGVMRGPDEGGPSFPAERLGESDAIEPSGRKLIDAEILVVVPAETATGAGDAPARVAGMGLIDADLARIIVAHTRTWTRAAVDPIRNTVLGIDSTERYIPSGLKKLLHLRQPTCGCGCGLPAHRADIDHVVRVEHDGRTRHDNLQILCRKAHIGKDAGYADVRRHPDGRIGFRNKWGGTRWVTPALTIATPVTKTPDTSPTRRDETPF